MSHADDRDAGAADGSPFDDHTRIGRDLQAVAWEHTPLGSPATWPHSLTTVVRSVIASRFSMWMAWGPELTFFCNDAYRRDTLGVKYPWALGRPAREVWAEIWDDVAPRIESVLAGGGATWDESLLLFLERSGYAEETYHTFSYSPLVDDRSAIAGMLCVVSEDTDRVIAERRMDTLRALGGALAAAISEDDVHAAACQQLGDNQRDLPFTLIYLFGDDRTSASLACRTVLPAGHPAAPPVITTADPAPAWPVELLRTGRSLVVDDLPERFADLPCGAWEEPPLRALAVPLAAGHDRRPYGFLVAGLNRYRPLDAAYRGFVELVAGQVSAAVVRARAHAAEQARVEQLAELDRAKTAFFTNVSHELRTPLTLLLGPAEDALGDPSAPLPEPHRQRVEIIQRNGERLLKLVNTLLDFSRMESGHVVGRFEPLDLPRYTADLAAMFESAVDRAGLQFTVECAPVGQPVYADREMWAKIVLNLLSNALKATFEGGITVRFGPADDDSVALTVSDTGVGIPHDDQARLFERFNRVLGARLRSHEGTGIGLALVAELAALHGGTVSVTSTVGRGSAFTVRIPLGSAHLPAEQVADAADDAPDAGSYSAGYLAEAARWLDDVAAAEPREPGKDAAGRPRVLVVDDNADMRDYISGLLADRYAVSTAADGAAALELVRSGPPDLVLTDVMMPRLDGFGLLAALRADPDTMHIPVVMVSARAGNEATVEGLEAGANDYLVKPFTARELLARVSANLELDRVRRMASDLERSKALLDQAERHAQLGSYEIDLRTGAVGGSAEYFRLLGDGADAVRAGGLTTVLDLLHPEDADRVRAAIEDSVRQRVPLDLEARIVPPGGAPRIVHVRGTVEADADGRPAYLRGSAQDVTAQRRTEQALATAAVEHRIAQDLQRSLLPPGEFRLAHLDVAAHYQPGVDGTQVGGDWYDVIELAGGRTALVIGDVMGRGVPAAAIMGQLRAALRAYSRLDLPPGEVLRLLDAAVDDLGADTIVTCLYAIHDPREHRLTYCSAGHLPALIADPSGVRRLPALGPPLGAGYPGGEEHVPLPPGSMLALYTDGLVERPGVDLDAGIDRLTAQLAGCADPLDRMPVTLVDSMLSDRPDDDIALLLAAARDGDRETPAHSATRRIPPDTTALAGAREFTATTLRGWDVPAEVTEDAVLVVSELLANAIVHAAPPITLRLHRAPDHVRVEVEDGSPVPPRALDVAPSAGHGRGLLIVGTLAERWSSRPTDHGKVVWCCLPLPSE